jgi:hypothetical protein
MPSGKQVSFEFGEVSPTLHFRSDAVSYSQGLSKLRNMFVRKEGGVSNRPGFKFIDEAISQLGIPSEGSNAGIKGFSYYGKPIVSVTSISLVSASRNIASIVSLGSDKWTYNFTSSVNNNWAVGSRVTSSGATNPANNGTFFILELGPNYMVVYNNSGVAQAGAAGSVNPRAVRYNTSENPTRDAIGERSVFVGCASAVNNGEFLFLNRGANYITVNSLSGVDQVGAGGVVDSFSFEMEKGWRKIEYYQIDALPKYAISVDGGQPIPFFSGVPTEILDTPPNKIRFTVLKDRVFISPNVTISDGVSSAKRNISVKDGYIIDTNGADSSTPITFLYTLVTEDYTSGTLQAAVSYMITAVLTDNTEVEVHYFDSNDTPNLHHPHQDLSNKMTFYISGNPDNIKHFNVYRAAGAPGSTNKKSLMFKFAGRIAYNKNSTTLKFGDYGADNAAVTPPLDDSMLDSLLYLSGAECATFYQQRLVMGMKPDTNKAIKAGDMLASKLGATEQIKAPVVYNNTGAFQFSVPIQDGTPVVALLSIQGLIAFTEKNVYLIRGADGSGQGGVITPTEVNPVLVSSEGCSKTVEPKSSGTKGFFINSSHTKLMAIGVGADGGVEIADASLFSEHTLYGDITEIAVVSGIEDTVYLLRRDGKLVRVTITGTGVFGFSVIETEGYIESIYTGKAKREYAPNTVSADAEKYHDVLMAYVIRNGVRILEQLVFREDKQYEAEYFADCFSSFGQRLADDGNNGYSANVNNYAANPGAGEINIESLTNFDAGSEVRLNMPAVTFADPNFVLHFFYENSDGEKCTIRFHSNGNAKAGNSYFGYFDEDLPAVLQDVDSQSISTYEKKRRKTRWLPAYNKIEGDDVLLGPWIASNNGQNPVSVMADGEIISSPLNPNKPSFYITKVLGVKTLILPDYYCFGYVGIPYESEFETLDLEDSSARTLSSDNKLINAVGVGFNQTRAGFFGTPNVELNQMEELVYREESSLNVDSGYLSGYLEVNFPSVYTRSGRVNIKNVDPAPISVLSVYPKGISGA